MNPAEISWRLTQKLSSEHERFRFLSHTPVTKTRFWNTGRHAHFDFRRLAINFDNNRTLRHSEISLLGPYEYREFANKWHAGFNTANEWPLTQSSKLRYKQRDDIGDARLNWELNRHHQLTLLAKEYYI
ncbi:MAG: hypothetical protein K2K94_02025, partial [Muribaculaceae bacterium]|nr:hypothetical protein [Muribaculaceae bacterium]